MFLFVSRAAKSLLYMSERRPFPVPVIRLYLTGVVIIQIICKIRCGLGKLRNDLIKQPQISFQFSQQSFRRINSDVCQVSLAKVFLDLIS